MSAILLQRSGKPNVNPRPDGAAQQLAFPEDVMTSEASPGVYPNIYVSYRNRYLREFASEFIGTMVMIVWVNFWLPCRGTHHSSMLNRFGLGANLQVALSSELKKK